MRVASGSGISSVGERKPSAVLITIVDVDSLWPASRIRVDLGTTPNEASSVGQMYGSVSD